MASLELHTNYVDADAASMLNAITTYMLPLYSTWFPLATY